MRSADLIAWLRAWADSGAAGPRESAAFRLAADRLEDLEERVAIMMEGSRITEEKYQQMKMEAYDDQLFDGIHPDGADRGVKRARGGVVVRAVHPHDEHR